MSHATAKEPIANLDRTLVRVSHGERVVLRQGKKAVAAVVPIDDLKRLQKLEDEEDVRDARAALKEASKKGTIPWEKVKAELGRPARQLEIRPLWGHPIAPRPFGLCAGEFTVPESFDEEALPDHVIESFEG